MVYPDFIISETDKRFVLNRHENLRTLLMPTFQAIQNVISMIRSFENQAN